MTENNRRGIVWSFFDEKDSVKKEAECKLCHNIYKYKGTSHNLKLHLKCKHSEVYMSLPESERSDRRSVNSTGVWQFFQPLDGDDKRATCLACHKTCSYKTTIANLKTHLRLMHHDLHERMAGADEVEYYVEDGNRTSGSHDEDAEDNGSVWSYYEQLSGRRARCVVCRATVARAELKSHLKVHHPKLVAEVDLGSEEEVSDSQEDVYTEVVYLEEEQNAKKAKSLQRKKAKPTPIERPEPRKRQASSSSDEIPLKQKKTENNDEVEQFGKYVTCLLRKIPAAECMELQAEIINLIMKKQLELKRKTSLSSVKTGADKMAGSEANNGISEFLNIPSTSNTLGFNNGYSNLTENKE